MCGGEVIPSGRELGKASKEVCLRELDCKVSSHEECKGNDTGTDISAGAKALRQGRIGMF